MIKDIRLGLSLMKYGLNYRMSIFGILLCLAATMFFMWLLPVAAVGGIILSVVPLFVAQLIFSLTVSTMAQTSPYKKRLQTSVPTIFAMICSLIANTIVVIIHWFNYQRVMNNTDPFLTITYEPGEYETGYLFTAIFLVWILLYTTLSMKYFWPATIIMVGGFWAVRAYVEQGELIYIVMPDWVAILLSYVIVLLGCAVFYLITCVTYKKPYSDITFDSLLKRAS